MTMNRIPKSDWPPVKTPPRRDNALRQILTVSKEDLLKMEAREKRKKERKKESKQRCRVGKNTQR